MEGERPEFERDDAPSEPTVHAAVWFAFAACGFVIILMSGLAATMFAILVLRGELASLQHPPAPTETVEKVRTRELGTCALA